MVDSMPSAARAAVYDQFHGIAEFRSDVCRTGRAESARKGWPKVPPAGRPSRCKSACATGCAGTRTAMVVKPGASQLACLSIGCRG